MGANAVNDRERLAGRTRWSMAVRCPRMASLALLGAEPEPLTPREEGRFQRGKDAQNFYGRKLVAKYGEENVIAEHTVAWPDPKPIGELHVDFKIIPESMAIECKSSESVDSLFESAVRQIGGPLVWDPDLETGAVVFLDRDYQETDVFPVILSDELRAEVEGIAEKVVTASRTGELPERICSKPSDGRGYFCPLIDHCFSDWEAPAIPEGRDPLPVLSTNAYLARERYETAKGSYETAEAEWEEARDALLEELPAGETTVPGLLVKRTDVADSKRFSLSKAEKAGMWTSVHEELFAPFVSMSGAHSRLTFKRTEGEDLEHEWQDDDEAPF